MQRRGVSQEDADTANKRYLFSECIIEPGIEVDVCGVVAEPDGHGRGGDGEPVQRTLTAPPDGSVLVASPVDDEA